MGRLVSEKVAAVEAIKREIGEEHALLHAHLHALVTDCAKLNSAEHCRNCETGKAEHCTDRALQHVGELLAYMVGHFRNEELVMRKFRLPATNPVLFDDHVQDHGRLSEGLSHLATELDDENPLPQLRQLRTLMSEWLHQHFVEHDNRLLAAIGADGLQ